MTMPYSLIPLIARRRLPGRIAILSLLCFSLFSMDIAYARDEVKPAPVQAQIKEEKPVLGQVLPLLTALPDGSLYSLDKKGAVARIDLETGQTRSLSDLPVFSTLTANKDGLWGVSEGKVPELYNFSPEGTIKNHFPLPEMTTPASHISSLQVGDHFAYLSDEGAPAFIVADLKTHHARRIMVNYPSLIAERPYKRNGKIERDGDGHFLSMGNVRYLALALDGKNLFYQTPPGPFYMIETVLLNDPTTSPAELLEAMVKWRNSFCLGGLAITPENTLYMVDVDHGDLIEDPKNQLPLRLLHDIKLTQARDMAFIPATASSKARLAVLIGTDNDMSSESKAQPSLKLLVIALP